MSTRTRLSIPDHNGIVKDSVNEGSESSMKKRTFLVLFAALLLDLIGFTMILPLFPSILEYYGQQKDDRVYNTIRNFTYDFREFIGAPDTARWNSVLFGGILGSLFSFLQFLSSPIVGSLSDAYGRKPILILTMMGLSTSYFLWSLSGASFSLFCLSRVVGGLSKANIGVATAVVSDVTTSKSRGQGMALIGVAFSVGFLVGPLCGVYFSLRSTSGTMDTNPAYLSLSLALMACALLLLQFEETLPKENRAKHMRHKLAESLNLINPYSLLTFSSMDSITEKNRKTLKRLGLAYFLYIFIYSGLEFNLTFLTHVQFEYTSADQGKMFCIMGVIMILVQGGFVRRVPAGRELRVATMGMVLAIPAFVLLGVSQSRSLFYTGLVLFSFASGTVVHCLTSCVSVALDPKFQGRGLGTLRSIGALARALGPLAASLGFWSCGPAITYCVGAILLAAPVLLLVHVHTAQTRVKQQ